MMRPFIALSLILLGSLSSACLGGPWKAPYADRYQDSPEAALKAALEKGGGLGSYDEVRILQSASAPESTVGIYAGFNGETWNVGLADAKRGLRGWWAHGMIGLSFGRPVEGQLTCETKVQPSGGSRWLIVSGSLPTTGPRTIEAVFADGSTEEAGIAEHVYGLLTPERDDLVAIRGLDANRTIVAEVSARSCRPR